MIYTAQPYLNNWDGSYNSQPLQSEAYYYVIKNGDELIKSGTVTLIK
jgi:gliding motility-associated-like protein